MTATASNPSPGTGAVTTIGVAGEDVVATVDDRGAITLPAIAGRDELVVEWCVRGEDRWYVPAREVTVRQRLLRSVPVPDTTLRVGAGDVAWRTYGVATGLGPVVVVETAVEGRLPVALAVVVRRRDGQPLQVTCDDAHGAIVVDQPLAPGGRGVRGAPRRDEPTPTIVCGPRLPSRLAAGRTLDDLLAGLDASDAELLGAGASAAGTVVAAVWPLAHGSTTGFVLPLDARTAAVRRRADLGPLASAEQVARGWAQQLDAAVRLDWPDETLVERVRRQRAALVLEAPHLADAAAAFVLDRWGHHDDAAVVLANLTDEVDRAPAGGAPLVVALAEHVRLTADADLARASIETVIAVVDLLGRRDDRAAALVRAAAAELLLQAGEPAAAAAVTRPRGWRFGSAGRAARPLGLPTDDRSPASTLRDAVVGDDPAAGELALLPGWQPAWAGVPIELHGVPTSFGRLSLALRWHGARPALLWELEADTTSADDDTVPVLVAPALDPSWQGRGRRGERLLQAPAGAEAAAEPAASTASARPAAVSPPPSPTVAPGPSDGDTVTFS